MDVKSLIAPDEPIVKELVLKGKLRLIPKTTVYATDKRLIIDRGEYIRDISYRHISSMVITDKLGIGYIIAGAIVALVGVVLLLNVIEYLEVLSGVLSWVLIALGLILIAYGSIKTKTLSLTVLGLGKPEVLCGARVDLEKLFVIVRGPYSDETEPEAISES